MREECSRELHEGGNCIYEVLTVRATQVRRREKKNLSVTLQC